MKVLKFVTCLISVLAVVIHLTSSTKVTEKSDQVNDDKSTIKSETDVTQNENVNSTDLKSRAVNDDVESEAKQFGTIPPTLTNVRSESDAVNLTAEKSGKVVKETSPSLVATSKNLGSLINSRVKQAFINSRQNSFEKLNRTFPNHNHHSDQDARPAEVSQVAQEVPPAKEIPPSTPTVKKEFYPSPEVNPVYNYESNFNPMSELTEYRQTKPDAQFNSHETFKSNWVGGEQQRQQSGHLQHPLDYMSPPQFRNTNIDLNNFNNYPPPPPRLLPSHAGDRVKFPDDSKQKSNEHSWPTTHGPVGDDLNYKKPKGTWKWIPDEDDEPISPEFVDNIRIPPTRDRPYSFETPSNYFYSSSNENRDKQKANTFPPPWTGDNLFTTEDYSTTFRNEEPNKGEVNGPQFRYDKV